MFKSIKKGIGFVVGVYLGLACTAVINGTLCSLLKTDKETKEEPKTEDETEE